MRSGTVAAHGQRAQRDRSNFGLTLIGSALVLQGARAAVAPSRMRCRVVAIDGPGGAGKSTLAALVARELDAQVGCTDDFASWDQPLEWWPRLIEQVLEPLSRNEPGRF
ncbi:MAG: (d)CMP kinase [Actinomycetota bacterium]|nr:(d)CMP kinase [Actinomycetota bacterium]